MIEQIQDIQSQLQKALPGLSAQQEMSHILRRSVKPRPADAQKAGVMVLLFPKNKEWHVALTERASKYAHDKHKGQMSFPGGKMEATDKNLRETAKRETEEEIGVAREKIHVLGELTELYIPVSNFLVQPVVGYVKEEPEFVIEKNEVAVLVSSSLKVICSEEVRKKKNIKIGKQITLNHVPYFDLENKVVWGATAMILNEFVTIIKQTSRV